MTIHSHPSSFPPSPEDFNSNFEHGNGKGIVCGHDGSVYLYEANELMQKERSDFYYRKYYNILKNENEAQKRLWEEMMQQYDIFIEEV